MRKAVWGVRIRLASALVLILGSASCGDLVRQGTASSYLVINELVAASGADPSNFSATLFSDVVTVKDDKPTIFADNGRVSFGIALKDPGSAGSPNSPSANNFITLDRYHVKYISRRWAERAGCGRPIRVRRRDDLHRHRRAE